LKHSLLSVIDFILEVYLRLGVNVILLWGWHRIYSEAKHAAKPINSIEKSFLFSYFYVLLLKVIDLIYAPVK